MNEKILIKGDTGAAINVENGGKVNVSINNPPLLIESATSSSEKEKRDIETSKNASIDLILTTVDEIECREILEAISLTFFGTKTLKSLELEELKSLHSILLVLSKDFKAKASGVYKNWEDWEAFQKRTGINASTPARSALDLLLEKDVRPDWLRIAWGSSLFYEDGRLVLKVSKMESHLYKFGIPLSIICSLPILFDLILKENFLLILLLGILMLLGYISSKHAIIPLHFAQRSKTMVEDVNRVLREKSKDENK